MERVAEGDTMLGNQLQGSVMLPMPKVVDTNGCEWGESEVNIFGLAALGTIETGGKLIRKGVERAFGGQRSVESLQQTKAVSYKHLRDHETRHDLV